MPHDHEKNCKSYYPNLIPAVRCPWCIALSAQKLDIADNVALYLEGRPHIAEVHRSAIDRIIKES